jgi:hypothetical protein
LVRELAMVDVVLGVPGAAGTPAGSYHLRVYRASAGGFLVVLGELSDNAGADVTTAVEQLADIVRRDHLPPKPGRVTWLLYFPYGHTPGSADRFLRVEPDGDDSGAVAAREVSGVEVERLVGTVVTRYPAVDYTCFGVRPSRRAVAGWVELTDRLSSSGRPAVTVTEAWAIVADMARALSQMREVTACLAADVASGAGPPALVEALTGPIQTNLAGAWT